MKIKLNTKYSVVKQETHKTSIDVKSFEENIKDGIRKGLVDDMESLNNFICDYFEYEGIDEIIHPSDKNNDPDDAEIEIENLDELYEYFFNHK